MKKIPLIKPYITPKVKDRVLQVLESGYLTEGPVTRQFERAVKEYIGCKYVLAVCNCTAGLETALRALGVGSGDEVIVPDYTYPATAAVVEIVGAKIVIVDINRDTMLIDYDALESAITPQTKAVVPVSLFGNPLDYQRIDKIKRSYNLYIVEDAACALGAKYTEKRVGNMTDIAVFSLHPRKFITTGEGGVITTNNSHWAEWMRSYKHFGMHQESERGSVQFERIGTNYKLSNVQAAIGLEQMRVIDPLLQKRIDLANRYKEILQDKPGITFPVVTDKGAHSWQSFCVYVQNRDEIIKALSEKNIETQIGTYALHMHKAFNQNRNCRITGDLPNSRYAFSHCLTLPLYHEMTFKDQDYIIEQLSGSLNG